MIVKKELISIILILFMIYLLNKQNCGNVRPAW